MRRSAVGVFILGIGLFESNTDFFQKNGADIERAVRGDRRRRNDGTELSGEIERYFYVDVHYRKDTSSDYSRRDTFFIEKFSMDDSFPCRSSCSLGEVPSLCSLDILKPEVNHSRMLCFEDEKRVMDSGLFFEEAEEPEKGERSAAGFRATKCDAEEQLQFRGNDGRLEDSGPNVDRTSPSGKNGAESSVHGNRRSCRPRQVDRSSLSEEEKEKLPVGTAPSRGRLRPESPDARGFGPRRRRTRGRAYAQEHRNYS